MTEIIDKELNNTTVTVEEINNSGALKRTNSDSDLKDTENTKVLKLENQLNKKFIKLSLWDIRNSKEIQNQNVDLLSVTNPLQFALDNITNKPSENYPNEAEFIVEKIIAKKISKDVKVEYLVKWKELEESKCFWVSESELEKFREILDCFELSLETGRKSTSTTTSEDETITIETFESNISIFMNLINHDNGYPISIVNTVDDSEPPNFIYTNNFILNEDIREKVLTDKTRLLQGCKCIMCPPFNPKQKCDCVDWTGKNPYNNKGLVDMESGGQIYECNLDCACAKITPCLCRNRVTQRTRKHKLQIYKTPNKGWAVRALEDIPKGTFISIYTGLVMSLELANQLGKSYETKGFSYLFDLDGDTAKGSDPIYTVDATDIGNFSRFINHSCDPNLYILSVFTDHQDIHNIGLFAKRDIKAQEEICYDYTGGKPQDDNFDTGITCYCGAINCKKVLMM